MKHKTIIGSKEYFADMQVNNKIQNKENFIRDLILDDPSQLGLGDVVPSGREVKNKRGSLDLLLLSDDGSTHYNVEVQMGSADEKHLFKTITYYLQEKQKYPDKIHRAVIVAEDFDQKYNLALQHIGITTPYIAIKMHTLSIEQVEDPIIHFELFMDNYQQQETDEPKIDHDIAYWTETPSRKRAWDTAMRLVKDFELAYVGTQHYVGVKVHNKNYFGTWEVKSKDYVTIGFPRTDEIEKLVNEYEHKAVGITYRKSEQIRFKISYAKLDNYMPLITQIYELGR